MKLRWKIYIICIVIYITALVFTCIIVTENTYASLLNKEVERALQEEKNMRDSALLFLVSSQKLQEEKIDLFHYSGMIVDIFSGKNSFIEIYNKDKEKLASTLNTEWNFKRDDLDKVQLEGKCYVLRKDNDRRYLFVSDLMRLEQEELILCYIKDISEINNQKNEQYWFFLRTGASGLILMAFVVIFLSRIIIKPVDNLVQASRRIAEGNFTERVVVSGKDEISLLGSQFNVMAEEIEHKISELRSETEKKQRFIDNLSHELRTPLTSIIGYSELLKKVKYDENTFNKGLSYIHSEGNRILRLTNSLMEIILSRESELELIETDVISLLFEVKEIMEPKLAEREMSIRVVGEDTVIMLDREMIKGALINLVENAIKASVSKSSIIIGADNSEERGCIFVQDEGKGMDECEISKIMEPFYRVDKARSKKDGGVGLGLAICGQIVEKHGAKMSISSKLGEGTKVSIIFSRN
jgi:signal transduction histidine kinase